MKIKHKVLKDFQHITPDKKIVILKSNSIIEEYIYKTKNDSISIEKDIIDNNPEYFQNIDWKAELLSHLKAHKIPQPTQIVKKIAPFIEETFILSSEANSNLEYDDKMKKLNLREIELSNLEKKLQQKIEESEKSLESKQMELETLYKEKVNSLLKDVAENQSGISEKEGMLTKRNQELDNKEKLLSIKENELNNRQSLIEDEENRINTLKKEHMNESDLIKVLTTIRDEYYRTGHTRHLDLFDKYGYSYDERGIYKKAKS